ncbi:MAG TPA: cytochrome c biogenesis protein ResB [Tepidisphaeraceae bacterium]|nr:cytochrome c biogenesis protein ResB [Tepidisphaeraceae bacterium]
MIWLLDKLLEICSSLKLAICVILSLAFYLGAATCYEARYGTRAVQEVIYGSKPFILLMAMLSINVMAAVIARYPWKRKHTGFIITHCGIETLLLGCLISFRFSVDGRVSLSPGQQTEAINLNDEDVSVTAPDAGGIQRRHVEPVHLWADAGYPGLARFVLGSAHLIDLPQEARWPDGHTVQWPMGEGIKLTVLDWLPAAVPQTLIQPSPDGYPSAIVHLGGSLPNGMPMDQDIPLTADPQGDGLVPFNGMLEFDLWKARSDAELQEFLHPPDPSTLPERGRLVIFLDGQRYTLDVKAELQGKDQPLGDGTYKAAVTDYTERPAPPQLPENHGQAAIATPPIDPQVSLRLTGPKGVRTYLVGAWHPEFVARIDGADASQHGMPAPDDPIIYYWHPEAYFTARGGTMGRLQLIQSASGDLYARMFGLREMSPQPFAPFKVDVGREFPQRWANISITVADHAASGVVVNDFRPAHVIASQMDDHTRAMKVALTVDGNTQETWLEREAGPVELQTNRGPVELEYGFRQYELGFSVGLNHAEQINDPGTDQAAAYSSDVTVNGSNRDGDHTISMNKPMAVQGLTFYQAGFSQDGGVFSTLSVRYDPGWVIKYLGCALIVGGIFTMFYMKAYFQKTPPAPAPAAATRKPAKAKAVQVG